MSIICTCVNIHACIFWPCELDFSEGFPLKKLVSICVMIRAHLRALWHPFFTFFNVYETAWPIKAKLYMDDDDDCFKDIYGE